MKSVSVVLVRRDLLGVVRMLFMDTRFERGRVGVHVLAGVRHGCGISVDGGFVSSDCERS